MYVPDWHRVFISFFPTEPRRRVELFNELVCNVTQAAICGEH